MGFVPSFKVPSLAALVFISLVLLFEVYDMSWMYSDKEVRLVDRRRKVSTGSHADKCIAKIKDTCVKGDILYSADNHHTSQPFKVKFPRFWRGGANAPFKDAYSNLGWRGPFSRMVKLGVSEFAAFKRDLPYVPGTTLYHYYNPVSHTHKEQNYQSKLRPPLNAAHAMWDIIWLELIVAFSRQYNTVKNIVYREDFEEDDPVHGLCEIIRKAAYIDNVLKVHQDGCFEELLVVVASCDRHMSMLPTKISAHILGKVRGKIHEEFFPQNGYKEKKTVLLYGRTDTIQRKMLNVYDVYKEVKSSLSVNVTLWDELILHKMMLPAEQFHTITNSWYVITPHGAFTCFWWPWLKQNATLHEIMGPCPKLHSDRNGRTYVNEEVARLLDVKHLYQRGHNLWEKKVARDGMKELRCKSHYTDPNFITSPASVVKALKKINFS